MAEPTRSAVPGRLRSADAFRALATVWVIVIHTVHWAGGDFYLGLDLISRFAVPAFVVLTGVLLSYRYGGTPIDRATFMRRRLSRTLIPFAVWAPVFAVFGWFVTGDPAQHLSSIWVFLYWGAGHLWFLWLIPQLYVVYLLWPRRGLGLAAILALTIETALCVAHLYTALPDGVPRSLLQEHAFQLFPFWIGYFAVGVLAGRMLANRGEPDRMRPLPIAACVLAIGAAGWFQVRSFGGVTAPLQTGTGAFVLPQEPLLVLSIGMLVLLTARPLLTRRPRLAAATTVIADNSLGIYILHPLVVYGVGRLIFPLLSQPFPVSIPGFLVLTLAGLLISMGLARLLAATPLAPSVGAPRRALPRLATRGGATRARV